MRRLRILRPSVFWLPLLLILCAEQIPAQQAGQAGSPPMLQSLGTPLSPDVLKLLANEISGQMIYNNLVKLAGAVGP